MRLRSSVGRSWRRIRLCRSGGIGVIALEVLGLTGGLAGVLRVEVAAHLCGFLTVIKKITLGKSRQLEILKRGKGVLSYE
jgi:hypothetical protein